MPLYFAYVMVQKSQNDQKLKSKGSCLNKMTVQNMMLLCTHPGTDEMVKQPHPVHAEITVQTGVGRCAPPRNPPCGQIPHPRAKRSGQIPHGLPGEGG